MEFIIDHTNNTIVIKSKQDLSKLTNEDIIDIIIKFLIECKDTEMKKGITKD
jgi:hypothetical protein